MMLWWTMVEELRRNETINVPLPFGALPMRAV